VFALVDSAVGLLLYNWFLLSLHAPAISYWHAVGLFMLISLINYNYVPVPKVSEEELAFLRGQSRWAHAIFWVLCLGIAGIAKLFL
jgi:hypothetical protein